ncbi:hypothetical protein [Mobilicoccus pelagius]|uniref:hypothetical protein n=1 Tax=Mobilicoccus pelagius TaxID=746032 RepID=UPI00145C481F|nr:hypothetical protein [Mobilicoccus pelagius]
MEYWTRQAGVRVAESPSAERTAVARTLAAERRAELQRVAVEELEAPLRAALGDVTRRLDLRRALTEGIADAPEEDLEAVMDPKTMAVRAEVETGDLGRLLRKVRLLELGAGMSTADAVRALSTLLRDRALVGQAQAAGEGACPACGRSGEAGGDVLFVERYALTEPGQAARLLRTDRVEGGATVPLWAGSRVVDAAGRQVTHEGRPLRDPRLSEDGTVVVDAEIVEEDR